MRSRKGEPLLRGAGREKKVDREQHCSPDVAPQAGFTRGHHAYTRRQRLRAPPWRVYLEAAFRSGQGAARERCGAAPKLVSRERGVDFQRELRANASFPCDGEPSLPA